MNWELRLYKEPYAISKSRLMSIRIITRFFELGARTFGLGPDNGLSERLHGSI